MTSTATAEVAELRAKIEALEEKIEDLARDVFTPVEIARRFRIRPEAVYAACHTGLLVAEQRPTHGGKLGYLITLDDARTWRAQVRKLNQ
ncbi:MAG: hypothetical protein V4537_18135 [Pseudomonadota bacterium]